MSRAAGSPRNDRAVKIASDIAQKAKIVADVRGLTITEYLTGLLRPLVERDLAPALEKIQGHQVTN
jgi:hypothetical protein